MPRSIPMNNLVIILGKFKVEISNKLPQVGLDYPESRFETFQIYQHISCKRNGAHCWNVDWRAFYLSDIWLWCFKSHLWVIEFDLYCFFSVKLYKIPSLTISWFYFPSLHKFFFIENIHQKSLLIVYSAVRFSRKLVWILISNFREISTSVQSPSFVRNFYQELILFLSKH